MDREENSKMWGGGGTHRQQDSKEPLFQKRESGINIFENLKIFEIKHGP
jgi:hypothetical protein